LGLGHGQAAPKFGPSPEKFSKQQTAVESMQALISKRPKPAMMAAKAAA
jgi:hypothetical protein